MNGFGIHDFSVMPQLNIVFLDCRFDLLQDSMFSMSIYYDIMKSTSLFCIALASNCVPWSSISLAIRVSDVNVYSK
jgi:hypothetical protein